MAKEKKTFTDQEKEILRKQKMDWRYWAILNRLPFSVIVKHRITGEIRVIEIPQILS